MKDQLLIVQELIQKIKDQLDLVAASLNQLIERIPARLKQLELVAEQVEDLEVDVDPRVYDQEQFNARVEFSRQRVPQINHEFGDNIGDAKLGCRIWLQPNPLLLTRNSCPDHSSLRPTLELS